MTVRELFDMADELATNALSMRTKLFEFNRLERRIRVDVLGEDPETAPDVTEDSMGISVPTLPSRYHDVYLYWMASMIFFHQGETEAYENERQMFEAAWIRFERDVCIALDGGLTAAGWLREAAGTAKITYQYENLSFSNPVDSVVIGMPYETEIEMEYGYTLEGAEVDIRMGDETISSCLSGSRIRIPQVRGDIRIKIVPEPTQSGLDNLIELIGIADGKRISVGFGINVDATGYAAVGEDNASEHLIRLRTGDVLRIQGISLPDSSDQKSTVVKYHADGRFMSGTYLYKGLYEWSGLVWNISNNRITALTLQDCRLRVCGPCSDSSEVTVTVNRDIQ